MSRRLTYLAIVAFPFFIPLTQPTSAQTPAPKEQKATELLESIAERVSGLRSPSNRISASATVGDLLWSRDEKRARAIFEALTNLFSELVSSMDFSNPEDYNTVSRLQQQRQQIVERIARHDPELSLSFLRATRPLFARSQSRNRNLSDNDQNLELHLASLIAQRDPRVALRLAREHLRRGVSHNQVSVLTQIQQKDAEAARHFYRDLVERIGAEDMSQNLEAFNVGWNLLNSFQPPQAHAETYRRLLETVSGRVLAISPGDATRIQLAQNVYSQIKWALPNIEKIAPERSAALREWSRAVDRTFDPQTRMYNELNELSQTGSVDDILSMASRYPVEAQQHVYQQAVWKAMNGGEHERARQIAKEMVSDPIQRQQMLDQIEHQLVWRASNEGNVAEARLAWGKIKSTEQRVQLMAQFAGNLAGRGEKQAAITILNEARSLLEAVPQSSQKFNAQLQFVRTYSTLDPDQANAMLQPMISQLNQLIAAAIVLDGIDHRTVQEGEWLAESYYSVNGLVNGMYQSLAQLAVSDFSSAKALADQFERPELRLMAQLAIAQVVLGTQANTGPQPIIFTNGRRMYSFH